MPVANAITRPHPDYTIPAAKYRTPRKAIQRAAAPSRYRPGRLRARSGRRVAVFVRTRTGVVQNAVLPPALAV